MNFIRNGKIARLSQPLREELNRRLDQGAQGGPLLQWLNSLPEVQAVLAADFGGRPINKQSLSQWRRGGYAEWLRQQEARALAGQSAVPSPSTDPMAAWIAARCLLAVREATGPGGAEAAPLKILHEACRDLVALRQANHTAARVQFDLVRCQLLSGLQLDPAAPSPASDPVRPGQTFEIFQLRPPRWPAREPGACHYQDAETTSHSPGGEGRGGLSSHHLEIHGPGIVGRPPSDPVRPSQTFEIFQPRLQRQKLPAQNGPGLKWLYRQLKPTQTKSKRIKVTMCARASPIPAARTHVHASRIAPPAPDRKFFTGFS